MKCCIVMFGHNRQVSEKEMDRRNATVNCVHDIFYVGRTEETSKKCLLLL